MVYAVTAVCMSVSLLLSFLASLEFTGPRLSLLFFLLVCLASIVLFVVFGGLISVLLPDQSHLILAGLRQEKWTALAGIVVMAWFGMWRLPQIIAEQRERRGDQSQ